MFLMEDDVFVDAIEDGKIVRVSRSYASKERLFVLRDGFQERMESEGNKSQAMVPSPRENRKVFGKSPLDLDKLRKPLDYLKNDVVSELIDNFHWEIARARKLKSLTRKQLASMVGGREEHIKMIENGILPRNDFVIVSKIEQILGINLRKSASSAKKEEVVSNSEIEVF